jgi:hypothetical protein
MAGRTGRGHRGRFGRGSGRSCLQSFERRQAPHLVASQRGVQNPREATAGPRPLPDDCRAPRRAAFTAERTALRLRFPDPFARFGRRGRLVVFRVATANLRGSTAASTILTGEREREIVLAGWVHHTGPAPAGSSLNRPGLFQTDLCRKKPRRGAWVQAIQMAAARSSETAIGFS